MLWVGKTYFPQLREELREESVNLAVKQYFSMLSRGRVACAERFKAQRLCVTRFLSGSPIKPEGIRVDKLLLPVVLPRELRDLIEQGDLQAIRWSLTLLSLSRSILGGKPVDTQSITEAGITSYSDVISDYEIIQFWQSLGRPKLPFHWLKFHWSTKAGPNGPALQGALSDLKLLPDSLIESLKVFYPESAPIWGLLSARSSPLFQVWLKVLKIPLRGIRRLSIKDDREAKSRVFAILDYWSQSALITLHSGLFGLLRKLKCDCTFNQTRLNDEFAKNFNTSNSYHSLDLTAATDRFPLIVQKKLLSLLTSTQVSEAWANIMVGEEFKLSNKSLRYNSGQPMGAYSSWALFTLSHHMIVYIAARRLGFKRFRDYMILGDDIVIHNDKVADQYRLILSGLRVSFSLPKSHVSKDTFEFAKRWFHKGSEVSPWPIHGFLATLGNWPLLVEFLSREVPSRGYESILDLGPRLDSLADINPSHRGFKSLVKRMKIYISLPHWYVPDLGIMTDKLNAGLLLTRSNISVPEGFTSLLDWFSAVTNLYVRQELQKGISTISRTLDKLWSNLESELAKVGANHTPSPPPFLPEHVPLVKVLQDLSDPELQYLGSIPVGKSLLDPVLLWAKWKDIDLLNIPKLGGIIPLRAKERKVHSQSLLGLRLWAKFTRTDSAILAEEIRVDRAPRVRRKRKV